MTAKRCGKPFRLRACEMVERLIADSMAKAVSERKRREYYASLPPSVLNCFCSALGRMAPCSWCTDPARTEEDFG